MVLTCGQMLEVEKAAISEEETAGFLMEQAGLGIAEAIYQQYPDYQSCIIYAGKGNNAGDAFVAAKHLIQAGWQVSVRMAYTKDQMGGLPLRKLMELGSDIETIDAPPTIQGRILLLDGLVGLGAKGPLRPPLDEIAAEMNDLRNSQHAEIVAIDLPSGLDGDTGDAHEVCVESNMTATIAFPKIGLFADTATRYTGRIALVRLPFLEEVAQDMDVQSDFELLMPTSLELRQILPYRSPDCHKTQFGRVGIIAGSPGMTGAAVLVAEAAVRSGAGLVSVYALGETYPILSIAMPPEIMVCQVDDYRDILERDHDALVIGPGLGKDNAEAVMEVCLQFKGPAILDADALNIFEGKPEKLGECAGPRLLTPHPGEMKRLIGENDLPRWEQVHKLTTDQPVTVLLKGARTVIGERGRPFSCNQTGSPGMATGGMGDVLSGICGALLGQGISTYDSAVLAAWLHGRSAEIARSYDGRSVESLAASDISCNLGLAFHSLKSADY